MEVVERQRRSQTLMLILSACLLAFSHASSASLHHRKQSTTPSEEIVWTGYAGNAQHTSLSKYSPSGYGTIAWSALLDQNPPINGSDLAIHYGAGSLTANTLVYPYRYTGGFEFLARRISNGQLVWSYLSNYKFPPSGWDWIPPVSGTLLPDGSYAGPLVGGGIFVRSHSDQTAQPIKTYYPYSLAKSVSTYFNNVFISTGITADSAGNIYYGIRTYTNLPNGLKSGFVKMSESGVATIYSSTNSLWPSMNAAPTLSNDGKTVYVSEISAANGWESHLIALDTSTMTQKADALLVDPYGGQANAHGDSTASPMVGPDGDVYYGVMYGFNSHGWLDHFDSNLNLKGARGAFGWDDTPSIVPSSLVPSYTGTSSYLLFCKYNHYADFGQEAGNNTVAVIDPNSQYTDPVTGATIMKPVFTTLGVTPDPRFIATYPNAVREWCINSAAVDIPGKSVVVNCEDGTVYKLDLTTGALTSRIAVTDGIGEPYTPTMIAKDGTIFAVSKARIFAIRAKAVHVVTTAVADRSVSGASHSAVAPNRR